MKYNLSLGLILCGMLVFPNDSYCQNQKTIDSLTLSLGKQTGSGRFSALYNLAFEYVHHDNTKALTIIQEAEQTAMLSGDSVKIVTSRRVHGYILYLLNRPQEAISIIEPLLQNSDLQTFGNEYLMIMNLAAACYGLTAQFDKGLECQFHLLEEAQRTGNNKFISVGFRNMGFVYYKLKDYKKAMHLMKKSLESDPKSQANIVNLVNISLCYAHLMSFDTARIYLAQAVTSCEGDCPADIRMHSKYSSGYINYGLGRYEHARVDFLESLALAKQIDHTRMQLDNIYQLAKIFIKKDEIQTAWSYLREGERLIQSGTPYNLEIIKVYEQLSELYVSMRDFQRASFYQSRYITLKDSLYNEAVINSLMAIESKHLEQENEFTIAEQQKAIHLNEEIMDRQYKLNLLSVVVVVLTIAIIIFLLGNHHKNRELNVLLERKVQERTAELEVNRRELLRKLRQRELSIVRASAHIREKVNTLKGLCVAAGEDILDPTARQYVERINSSSNQIENYLRCVLAEGVK